MSDLALPDFSRRADAPEWMDDDAVDLETFRGCLKDLAKVNVVTLAYRPTLAFLDQLRRSGRWPSGRPLEVLDVGSGYGDSLRRIDRWARIARTPLHPNSVIPLLRRLFAQAGLPSPDGYSGHSLRRGFAAWADAKGWDVKSLMEYVGWKDVQSAMRYLDGSDPFARERIEHGVVSHTRAPVSLPAPNSAFVSEG